MARVVRIFLTVAFVSLVTGCATAPPQKPGIRSGDTAAVTAHLEELISYEMTQNDLTGLSVAIIRDGETVWGEGFGSVDLQTKAPITGDSLFRAGSTAKLFNAVKIMQLVEQGRVELDQDIRTYLPNFSIKSRTQDTPVITLRQLLSHQSGLPSDRAEGMWSHEEPAAFESMLNHLSSTYLTSPPGSVFSYSNLGFDVIGQIIAAIEGADYPEVMEALLTQLDMEQSAFSASPDEPLVAKGYSHGKPRTELSLRDVPAGGLSTSALDLAHIIELFANDGKVGDERIITQESMAEILRDQTSHQPLNIGVHAGLGIFQYDGALHRDLEIYMHNGATHSHRALIMFSAKHRYGIALLSNSQNSDRSLRTIAERGLALLHEVTYGEPPEKITSAWPKNTKEDRTDLDSITGYYATPIGLARFLNDNDTLKVKFSDKLFKTHRHQDQGPRYLSYRLFGILPIDLGELGRVGFSTREVQGNKLLIATNLIGHSRVAGVQVQPVPVSEAWKSRLGEYELISEFPVADVKSGGLAFKDGFMVAFAKLKTGEKLEYVLQPIDDQQAIVAGLGRSLGETVTARSTEGGEVFEYGGLIFKRVR